MIIHIQLQLLFVLKGIFLITTFQEKAENKDIISESNTTFINDFNEQRKQISSYNINFHLGRGESFFKR